MTRPVPYAVALDTGGTSMKGGLVTRRGEGTVLFGRPTGRRNGPDAVVEAVRAHVGEIPDLGRSRYGAPPAAVGLAVPGIVTASTAVYSADIGRREVPAMVGAALLGWQAAGDHDAGADWTLDVLEGGSVS